MIIPNLFIFSKNIKKLRKLDVENGISQNTINAIYEDKYGFIWLATNDGLNRLEGDKIEVFYSDINSDCSLKSDKVLDLEEDNQERLWIASMGTGLSYYEFKNNCFKQLEINYKKYQQLIQSIYIDTTSNLIWAATDGGGIFAYNYKTKRKRNYDKFTDKKIQQSRYSYISSINNEIYIGSESGEIVVFDSTNSIRNVYKVGNSKIVGIKSHSEKLFIVTESEGYFIYDPNISKKYQSFSALESIKLPEIQIINSLFQIDTNLFIISSPNGIYNIELSNDSIHIVTSITNENTNLKYDSFNCSYIDSRGTKWYGSNGYGIYFENKYLDLFKLIKNETTDPSLTFSSIRALHRTDSILWIGGYGGINRINLKNNNIENIEYKDYEKVDKNWNKFIFSKSIYCFFQDPYDEDIIWIGSEGNGLYKYSKKKDKFKFIKIRNNNTNEAVNFVYKIGIYGRNFILSTSLGIYAFEPKSEIYTQIEIINNKLSKETISIKSMFIENNIIFAVLDGLGVYSYNLENTNLIALSDFFPNYNKLLFKNINSIKKFGSKILLGSKENGLLILDTLKGKLVQYNTKNGLLNNCVYEILIEDKNTLWLSTNKGLSKLDLKSKNIINFNSRVFELNLEYNQNAAFKDLENNFYFGGIDGLVYFNSSRLDSFKTNSEILVKSIELNNDKQIDYYFFPNEDTITIGYIDDLVEIKLTTNEYLLTKSLIHKYRLNKSEYKIVYGNKFKISGLDKGLNIIEINSISNDHKSNNIKKLYIYVNVPFWESTWFYVLLALIICSIIYYLYNMKLNRKNKKIKQQAKNINRINALYSRIKYNFNLLDENISNLIWQVDKDFNFIFYTSNIVNYYKLNPTKLVNNLSDIYIDEDLNEIKNDFLLKNNFRRTIEAKLFIKHSLIISDEYSVVKLIKKIDSNGNLINITGIVDDTREKNKTKKQLREREELFSTLVGNILEPILITSWEGEILFSNYEANNVLELNVNDVSENLLFDFLDDPINHDLRKKMYIVKTGDTFEKVLFELIVNEKKKTIEGNGTKIKYFERSVFLFTFRDVTERINLIKELTSAKITAEQTSELKTMYLSNLTHELKTPINAISGFTDILISKSLDSFQIKHLESIKNGTNLLLQLINDLLYYTKAESKKLELRPVPTNIKTLVSDIENIFSIDLKNKNLVLNTEIDSNGIEQLLNIDQLKYKQIIINLINNAIKYTKEGEILLSLDLKKVNYNQVNLTLIVEDSGIGIPNSKIENIFTAFRQVNFEDEDKGFGLGLAIVKRIVDSMKGEIYVTSEIGKGTKFTVIVKNINLVINQSLSRKSKEDSDMVESYIRRDNKLNIYSKETLVLIQTLINGKYSVKLKNIKSNFLLKDISEFSEELYSQSNELGVNFISNYAKELQNASKTIDVEKISDLLENFYKLVDMIDKLLNKIDENE